MATVFLGLGSNLGKPGRQLARAIGHLEKAGLSAHRISSLYQTEPVGPVDQPDFLNLVLQTSSTHPPTRILRTCLDIEKLLGRKRTIRWGPRTIDIDVLYYGSRIMDGPDLTIPHPELAGRRFLLEPLTEIAPDFVDPVHQVTVARLLASCPDQCGVRKLGPLQV